MNTTTQFNGTEQERLALANVIADSLADELPVRKAKTRRPKQAKTIKADTFNGVKVEALPTEIRLAKELAEGLLTFEQFQQAMAYHFAPKPTPMPTPVPTSAPTKKELDPRSAKIVKMAKTFVSLQEAIHFLNVKVFNRLVTTDEADLILGAVSTHFHEMRKEAEQDELRKNALKFSAFGIRIGNDVSATKKELNRAIVRLLGPAYTNYRQEQLAKGKGQMLSESLADLIFRDHYATRRQNYGVWQWDTFQTQLIYEGVCKHAVETAYAAYQQDRADKQKEEAWDYKSEQLQKMIESIDIDVEIDIDPETGEIIEIEDTESGSISLRIQGTIDDDGYGGNSDFGIDEAWEAGQLPDKEIKPRVGIKTQQWLIAMEEFRQLFEKSASYNAEMRRKLLIDTKKGFQNDGTRVETDAIDWENEGIKLENRIPISTFLKSSGLMTPPSAYYQAFASGNGGITYIPTEGLIELFTQNFKDKIQSRRDLPKNPFDFRDDSEQTYIPKSEMSAPVMDDDIPF